MKNERWRGDEIAEGYLAQLEAELTTATANHYDAVRNCLVIAGILGWGSIILSALTASALIKDASPLLVGILGILATILTVALKSHGPDLQERAKVHREVGAEFLTIRDRVSQLKAEDPKMTAADSRISKILEDKAATTKKAPSLPYIVFYVLPQTRTVLLVLILFVAAISATYWFASSKTTDHKADEKKAEISTLS